MTSWCSIGLRVNKPLHVHQWLPVIRAMPRMITELYRYPELGFIHAESWFSRTTIMVQYWRSVEQLISYAQINMGSTCPPGRPLTGPSASTVRWASGTRLTWWPGAITRTCMCEYAGLRPGQSWYARTRHGAHALCGGEDPIFARMTTPKPAMSRATQVKK